MSQLVNPVSTNPVGSVVLWPYPTLPTDTDWLLLDGSSFNAAEYPELNSLNGGTTLPDWRFRFPVGAFAGAPFFVPPGVIGGSSTHSHTTPHTHTVDPPPTVSGGPSATVQSGILGLLTTAASPGHTHSTDVPSFSSGAASTPASSVADNNPPFVTVHFIIKGR